MVGPDYNYWLASNPVNSTQTPWMVSLSVLDLAGWIDETARRKSAKLTPAPNRSKLNHALSQMSHIPTWMQSHRCQQHKPPSHRKPTQSVAPSSRLFRASHQRISRRTSNKLSNLHMKTAAKLLENLTQKVMGGHLWLSKCLGLYAASRQKVKQRCIPRIEL